MAKIRFVTENDAEAILDIYKEYINNTAITFETEIPSVSSFKERIKTISSSYPYLVIEDQDGIAGYAYSHDYYGRKAYEWSNEVSIYISLNKKRKGYGKLLYKALEDILKKMGILNLYACIAYTDLPDPFLTNDSVTFHEVLGYKKIADFKNAGNKFGRWYSIIWMEKILGEHVINPKPVKFINEFKKEELL
ncbi:MAG: GNAT family N-acetyltransferase [Acholeplasmatales bacterium]|nr:GNAT family N-acetyltransferase [Acholeplasmatales bacterium]